MQGATWRECPDRVQEWVGGTVEIRPSRCILPAYGFHVGCKTAIALGDLGLSTRTP